MYEANLLPGSERQIDVYDTALYCRLSVLDSGKLDGESIQNQIDLLERFVASRADLNRVELFVDNGFTGTNFERPEWERLIQAVRQKKINCIVVKDLSRLGRNYIEAGEFLEKVCPFLGIRFISINDGYDSLSVSSSDALSASLKNIVNDYYAKDISLKSGSSLKAKRQRGDYIGNYAPHGYRKDPENKNHLLVDPESAPVIQRLFDYFDQGNSYMAVARMLNEAGYPSPERYRFEQGILTNYSKIASSILWTRRVVKDILQNIAYIGHLAQGKSTKCLYKGIPEHTVPQAEWDIAYNTHEPIIEQALFERVQEEVKRRLDATKKNQNKYSHLPPNKAIFGKKLRCGICGSTIKRYRCLSHGGQRAWFSYRCRKKSDHGSEVCSQENIREADLHNAVLETIKAQIALFMDTRAVVEAASARQRDDAICDASTNEQHTLEGRLQRSHSLMSSLYQDYKEGILSLSEYQFAKEKYSNEIIQIEQRLNVLKGITPVVDKALLQTKKWNDILETYRSATEITSEIVDTLIESVRVDNPTSITVELKFKDEMELLLAACRQRREEVA